MLLSPPEPASAVTIEVTGHQWWWEVRYPEEQVVTANEIHIPVGRPVRVDMTSADVIHSFWVPELHGKMDMIPGRTDVIWLQTDVPGSYRGQCAEFCGLQHAKMALYVVAEPPETFAAWLDQQRQPAAEPTEPPAQRGRALAAGLCIQCHTIRTGDAAVGGSFGPDLTHVGSRRTLAAATLPNTREHLAEWLADPQSSKPGNKMPNLQLDVESVQALVAYLESLR